VIVIGLSGTIGAGKDAVADILVRDHGFIKMSFAGAVKRLVRDLDPVVGYSVYVCDCGNLNDCPIDAAEVKVSDLYDSYGYDDETIKDSPYGDEVRRLWQRFGTDVMRQQDPEFWVNLALDDLGKQDAERVVFTDVRFPNEAAMIQNLSGPFFADGELSFSRISSAVWRIARSMDDGVGEIGQHESEQHAGLLGEEITIVNDASLEELAEAVEIAVDLTAEGEDSWDQEPLWEVEACVEQ
jgi:hypothetical protein